MQEIKSYEEYLESIKTLNLYAKHYYELDDPIASDFEYDMLYKAVKLYEENNIDKISKDSPTQRVGDKILKDFSKNKHKKRMWSLEDIFNPSDLDEWLTKLSNAIAKVQKTTLSPTLFDTETQIDSINNLAFCISPKYDGMSLNLLYENGILQSATTRGDGEIGEVVTQNAKTLHSLPHTIPFKGSIEIRGEVVLSKENFARLNKEQERNNKALFANPRNAAAGSMRRIKF